MPPSWSSRFLAGGSSSNTSSSKAPASNRDKPLPPRPPGPDDATRAETLPTRPKTAGNMGRTHTHGRSVSHPLPRLFSRKKSTGNLGGSGSAFNDSDLPLDEALVPVLDEVVDVGQPARVISGKRKMVGVEGDEGKVMRRCICCDSRVKVPRELERFRCMCCLTICDLGAGREKVVEGSGMQRQAMKMPLSVERTRAIIDKCLVTYLEARCRRTDEVATKGKERERVEEKGKERPVPTSSTSDSVTGSIPIRPQREHRGSTQLVDPPVSTSPPESPITNSFNHDGTVKSFADFDLFAHDRVDNPPPSTQPLVSGPGPPLSSSVPRKPVPQQPPRRPPPAPIAVGSRTSSRLNGNSGPGRIEDGSSRPMHSPRLTAEEAEQRKRYDRVKTIFRPLEDYISSHFGDFQCLNTSFSTVRPERTGRTKSESNIVTPPPEPAEGVAPSPINAFNELDAKTLLLGDIGENGSWWTGRVDRVDADKALKRKKIGSGSAKPVSSKSPNINWAHAAAWYSLVHSAGLGWQRKVERLNTELASAVSEHLEGTANADDIEEELAEARDHAVRALLKVTENLLKRPSKLLKEPEDMRFLLIVMANPSLYPSKVKDMPQRASSGGAARPSRTDSGRANGLRPPNSPKHVQTAPKSPGRDGSNHAGILKRVFGLMANSPDICHRYLITWFSRFDEEQLTSHVDLVASFVTHRIARRAGKPRRKSNVVDNGLIPDLSGGAMNTSAQLHAAMGLGGSGSVKKGANEPDNETDWASDWQVKVAAKVMSLLFAANNIFQGRRRGDASADDTVRPQDKARRTGQLLHTSSFYNTLLDYHDLIADFKVWESKREKFAFCQYPLFLSMGAKIKILEYDARRQMEIKAREAYFDQVIRQRAIDGYFHLKVRRDCMVDDSLRQISQAVGAGQEELKKGLRVHFAGEEGVDAGGPRKEWFLMLVREVFDAEHGLFVYDDESHMGYFNPHTFETSDQYYLVGALLGLAIYNSTILDIALPPFAFRKLLAAAPSNPSATTNVASLTGTKGQMTYTLSDLAEFRPSLARGLQQLLDYPGNVEETYCWTFVAPLDRYGTVTEHPLIPNGENTPVTNANRAEFVDHYVRYLLDGAVARQFEPFKRGFFTVCAGNALSLFRAEEIELLVRGSDESLDVDSLRAVAVYENWKDPSTPLHYGLKNPAESVPVIQWFWDAFAAAPAPQQRRLLSFVTGSDRIPAVGATSLVLRIVAGGDGWSMAESERFPVARTCFNMLVLWRYESREVLERRLWRAVEESEGFGLK